MREPTWWYSAAPSLRSTLLAPVGRLWGALVRRRFLRTAPVHAALPVICIGNFTAGGAGKTPLALETARLLANMGHAPVFLSRGYGGRLAGPHWVDITRDTAADVGDEPLLLARAHPTLICRDRAAGARAIAEEAVRADVIIMDDGLQNPGLAKDLTLAVVDGARGVGNSRVMPAGPLRAPLAFQLGLAQAIVLNHGTSPPAHSTPPQPAAEICRAFSGPVLAGRILPQDTGGSLKARPVVAFAGIGVPERFFVTLRALGADIVAHVAFPDHHAFTPNDAAHLLGLARAHQALLVTTEKDRVRLAGTQGALKELHEVVHALPVRLEFSEPDEAKLRALLEKAISDHRH